MGSQPWTRTDTNDAVHVCGSLASLLGICLRGLDECPPGTFQNGVGRRYDRSLGRDGSETPDHRLAA